MIGMDGILVMLLLGTVAVLLNYVLMVVALWRRP